MDITINRALILSKSFKERISDLKHLRTEVSTTKRSWLGDNREDKIPMYDVKLLDNKILNLQKLLYKIETSIKGSNNIATIEVTQEIEDELFTSLG
jgi:hypothetical protein